MTRRFRTFGRPAVLASVALSLAACTATPSPAPTVSGSSVADTSPKAVFNFGTPAPPATLDPALTTDQESYRITRQILEGLVTVDPTTGKPAPSLATAWEVSDDQKTYTFTLREGVKFQDGTIFDAKAVCTNFQRWFNLPVALRQATGASAFGDLFRGYSDAGLFSDYRGCSPEGTGAVQLKLSDPNTGFLQALTTPAFAISSPKALKDGKADTLVTGADGSRSTAYGQHPVGTGPFVFENSTDGNVTLKSYAGYWGDRGDIGTIHFKVYANPIVRREALDNGDIDAYDNVTVDTMEALIKKGQQIVQRDPFSVMYLGINQAQSPLERPEIRQALELAIDKNALVRNFYIDGAGVATQFVPPRLSGFNNAAPGRGFDPGKARDLLKQAGYKGTPIPFYYPVNVTRPYLPAPEKIYAQIARQLTAVGFVIKPVPIPWTDGYVRQVTSEGSHGLHLLGVNGAYADPDNFLSPLFGSKTGQFGLNDPPLFADIQQARTMPDGDARSKLYKDINARIAAELPAIPLAFPISALAMSDKVISYPASPVLNEVFTQVKLKS